jgi:hypothetical protein
MSEGCHGVPRPDKPDRPRAGSFPVRRCRNHLASAVSVGPLIRVHAEHAPSTFPLIPASGDASPPPKRRAKLWARLHAAAERTTTYLLAY